MKPYKIGYVPGVYDLFHIGHLNLIERAKEMSEYLMVGVLSDDLVYHFKKKYPVIPLEERMRIVAAIHGVDEVVEVNFTNTVKMDAWKLYHYDAYFSGSDHGHEWDKEKADLQAVGSDIVFLPYTMSTSSSKIKQQIQGDCEKRRVYIFGAGKIGQRILKQLQSEDAKRKWQVEGFLDNAQEKHLTRVCTLPVYLPFDLLTLEQAAGGDFCVITALMKSEEASAQLRAMGIQQILTVEEI